MRMDAACDGKVYRHAAMQDGDPTEWQAQFMRVPQAQCGPVRVDSKGPDERYLFLSDILPTAWQVVA